MKLDKTCACCNDNCHRKAQRLAELSADYERDKNQLAQLLGTDPIHHHMVREITELAKEAQRLRSFQLKLENDIYRNAIEQAIVELCPRARPSQARRILRIGLGQDPNQIYNSAPDSSENAPGMGREEPGPRRPHPSENTPAQPPR